jgi:hypothetical protein
MHEIKELKPLPGGGVQIVFAGELPMPHEWHSFMKSVCIEHGVDPDHCRMQGDSGMQSMPAKVAGVAPVMVRVRPATLTITTNPKPKP